MSDTSPTASQALEEVGLLRARNDERTLNYYEELAKTYDADPAGALLKLWSFAVHAPRQAVTDFLVRYELFKKILDVPGCVAEFGVYNGQGLMSFAQFSAILEPNHVQRVIYGFDTFEGVPHVSKEDAAPGTAENIRVGGFRVDSYDRLTQAIALFDHNRFIGHRPKVALVKGDIRESVSRFLEENPHVIFAMLYLDIDIFEPTRIVLDTLLERVPKGGIVAFDELNTPAYPGETMALLRTMDLGQVELKRLPFCSRISYFVR
ncbi:TylF/MycF/NovP-related O-methyltransferase [Azospirillum lipoferum]|nr:TylF/MycF/NovP-related O-methyltransferase [Azospirillum lipoferum]